MNDSTIHIISHTTTTTTTTTAAAATTSIPMLIATVTTRKTFGAIPVHFESALFNLEHRQYFTKA